MWVSFRLLQELYKRSTWKAELLKAAYLVLVNPIRIYKHIRPNDDDEFSGWCFVGLLSCDQTGKLLVVFVDGDGSVYEWGPEQPDVADKWAPIGAQSGQGKYGRFGELTWDRN